MWQMMVCENYVYAKRLRPLYFLHISDSAINRNHHFRTTFSKQFDYLDGQTILLGIAVRDVYLEIFVANLFEKRVHYCRARNPVGIIVSEDDYVLILFHCPQNPSYRPLHTEHKHRVMNISFVYRSDKFFRRISRLNSAVVEQTSHQRRKCLQFLFYFYWRVLTQNPAFHMGYFRLEYR